MKNADVRGTCLALIKSRLGGPAGGRAPRAAALGWKLAQSDVSLDELVDLCEAVLGADGANGRWALSDPLRALMSEYGRVREGAAPARPVLTAARPARPRLVAQANGVDRSC